MPSYHYHLKLELYSHSDPTLFSATSDPGTDSKDPIWQPLTGANIFEDLPSHPRRRQEISRSKEVAFRYTEEHTQAASPDHLKQAPNRSTANVIDRGAPPGPLHDEEEDDDDDDDGRNLGFHSERQWRARSKSFPPPGFSAGIGPRTAVKDWRFGRVNIESYDLGDGFSKHRAESRMSAHSEAGPSNQATPAASLGPNLGGVGQATKARYVPLETKNTEAGWGIVHLYREDHEPEAMNSATSTSTAQAEEVTSDEHNDGTILCIPAVPSYMSPSDFLGFVGEKWRGDVSHYRMVMTSRMSRYMVLMKFRDNERAREWRKEFDGKAFSMESEICHVTFIKSITVETPGREKNKAADVSASPFASSSSGVINSLKPFPPPTPNLIELPTCAVCLERMDDTTGLMTILCQHVFHCTCLQTWKGQGCPVCRATNPRPGPDPYDPENPYSEPFGSRVTNLCSVCDTSSDLWICLICGNVGCGRYKGGHAKDHWKETAHCFSLELETQHVWDYAGDMWVHRLIREKGDGKVVEFPSNTSVPRRRGQASAAEGEDEEVVPRSKLDNIGFEYTHLLTSQLESQRLYFEEMVRKSADKAANTQASAEAALAQSQQALKELAALREEHRALKEETVPALERDLAREKTRSSKSTDLARNLGSALQEEKKVTEGLMKRIEHVNKELEVTKTAMEKLKLENQELTETNRDLTMFISGQEKLKELENEGKVGQGELADGTVSLPEERKRGKGKGKANR